MIPDDDEFTELVDGYFPRVDLVSAAANGVTRFLIAKSKHGVVEADVVRSLVAKANKTPQAVFSKDGRLLGLADPAHIQPVLTGDEPPAPKKTAPANLDLEPAPSGTVGMVAKAIAKASALEGQLSPAGALFAAVHARKPPFHRRVGRG